ncbi:MAG: phosphoribosylaminoimidazolesuccinocarboxamide synthase [Solirubrobacterales bacterium]|nr:phosphoribosylaminoimidazolesuccinocarboxamide synthase [Solirubrobacterales bacterium]
MSDFKNLPALDLPLVSKGKVRDTYELPGGDLLMVASDRISTYDAIHPNPIPGKGQVLTGTSVFWFEQLGELVENHLISTIEDVPPALRGRALKVKRLEMLPIECVVRGYLAGSGWSDYQETGAVCGVGLPDGLKESSELPEPIFTPATKADIGDHDENIDEAGAIEALGGDAELFAKVKRLSVAIYEHAREHAATKGIILADTKFEFGIDPDNGKITLGDEVLTPDSSRYWPADAYEPGHAQSSFDKQFVRDWARSTGWDKSPPAPEIPPHIVEQTQKRYIEAYERLSGKPFSGWLDSVGAIA